jgi:MFS family permease
MSALGYLAASIPPRLAIAGAAVAIPILAVQQMDDVLLGGALVSVSLGPSVVAAPLVGAALDRARRPGLLIAASGVLTALAFAITAFLGEVPLPVVFAALAMAGAAAPFFMGGISSFVAETIPDKRRAFAYDALSYNASAVGGPALVAVMLLLVPAPAALWMLSAAAALGAVSAVVIRRSSHSAPDGSVWESVKAGLGQIIGNRRLAVVTGASTLTQFGQGGLAIAAVALSIERIGSAAEGAVLVTAFAIGSLVGVAWETIRPTRARPHLVMMAGYLATGAFTIAAAFDLGTTWTIIAIGLSGVFTAASTTTMLFLRSHLSRPELKAQVFTVGAGLRTSASAAGAALAGTVTGLGGGLTLAGVGLAWAASAALMLAYPKERQPPKSLHTGFLLRVGGDGFPPAANDGGSS